MLNSAVGERKETLRELERNWKCPGVCCWTVRASRLPKVVEGEWSEAVWRGRPQVGLEVWPELWKGRGGGACRKGWG